MRYVASHPMENMAVIRISDTGDWYEIIADNPVRPTSELPSHLSMHDYLKGRGIDNKVVLHTHPTDFGGDDLLLRSYSPMCWETVVVHDSRNAGYRTQRFGYRAL